MTPEERELLRFQIGRYIWQRVADASELQATVWANGILDIFERTLGDLFIPADLMAELKEGE